MDRVWYGSHVPPLTTRHLRLGNESNAWSEPLAVVLEPSRIFVDRIGDRQVRPSRPEPSS
jgi:hypothetical protein